MEVPETTVSAVVSREPGEPGWFAARQPAVLKYLEAALGPDTDALAVALLAAANLVAAYEEAHGVPPRRVTAQGLLRGQKLVELESRVGEVPGGGTLSRQPALVAYIAEVVAAPALPLSEEERNKIALLLATVLLALDEMVTGNDIA